MRDYWHILNTIFLLLFKILRCNKRSFYLSCVFRCLHTLYSSVYPRKKAVNVMWDPWLPTCALLPAWALHYLQRSALGDFLFKVILAFSSLLQHYFLLNVNLNRRRNCVLCCSTVQKVESQMSPRNSTFLRPRETKGCSVKFWKV